MISEADGITQPVLGPSYGPTIEWTRPKLNKFKKALENAFKQQQSKEGTFEFEGHQFLIGYACYLVEYLDQKLK